MCSLTGSGHVAPACPQTPFEPVLAEHTLNFSLIHPRCQLWERRSEVLLLICLPQCPGQGLTLRGHLVSLWVKLSALPLGQEQANLWVWPAAPGAERSWPCLTSQDATQRRGSYVGLAALSCLLRPYMEHSASEIWLRIRFRENFQP